MTAPGRALAAAAGRAAATTAAGAVAFSRADLNHDGVVTFAEAVRVYPKLSEVHASKCDLNGDGVLDAREFGLLNNFLDVSG